MNTPSITKIMTISGVDKPTAESVKLCMTITRNELCGFVLGKRWEDMAAYKYGYGRVDLAMAIIDRLINTCGVEYAGEADIHDGPPMLYCNAGDTYSTTVLWFRGRWLVGCWGDIVERHPEMFQ